MLQPLIVDTGGLAHGVKTGTVKPAFGPPKTYVTMSWCGTSLAEWIRLGGIYSSAAHQALGYDPHTAVTCMACLSEGP